MDFIDSVEYPQTLADLLQEDFKERNVMDEERFAKRYEGWILYLMARGNTALLKRLALDFSVVFGITQKQVIDLLKKFKSTIYIDWLVGIQISDEMELKFTLRGLQKNETYDQPTQIQSLIYNSSEIKSLHPSIPISDTKLNNQVPDSQNPSITQTHENLSNPSHVIPNQPQDHQPSLSILNPDPCPTSPRNQLSILDPIQVQNFPKSASILLPSDSNQEIPKINQSNPNPNLPNHPHKLEDSSNLSHYHLDEFFISHEQTTTSNPRALDFLNLPLSPSPLAPCTDQTCSNLTFCTCCQFINSQIGTQKTLIVHKGVKRIPRTWKSDFFLFECQESCSCDKRTCSLTFFSGKNKYLPRVVVKNQQAKASKDLMRGEFVMEVFGQLGPVAFEKGVQMAEGIFMDLEKSNVRILNDDKCGNLVPVRIFSYFMGRVICRVALFADVFIFKGQNLALDYARLESFAESLQG